MRLRNPVELFAQAMENKLRENDHKGGWQAMSFDYLHAHLTHEVEELEYELFFQKDPDEIMREAIDVANFAMMIFDVARLQKEEQ